MTGFMKHLNFMVPQKLNFEDNEYFEKLNSYELSRNHSDDIRSVRLSCFLEKPESYHEICESVRKSFKTQQQYRALSHV